MTKFLPQALRIIGASCAEAITPSSPASWASFARWITSSWTIFTFFSAISSVVRPTEKPEWSKKPSSLRSSQSLSVRMVTASTSGAGMPSSFARFLTASADADIFFLPLSACMLTITTPFCTAAAIVRTSVFLMSYVLRSRNTPQPAATIASTAFGAPTASAISEPTLMPKTWGPTFSASSTAGHSSLKSAATMIRLPSIFNLFLLSPYGRSSRFHTQTKGASSYKEHSQTISKKQ